MIIFGADDYKLALKNVTNRKLGTGFGGITEVDVLVSDLLTREGKH